MTYNLTILQESFTVSSIVTTANSYTDGLFFGLIMLGVFFISLIMSKTRASFPNAIIASSAFCFVLSLVLTRGGLLNFAYPVGFLIIMAFGGLYRVTAGNQ